MRHVNQALSQHNLQLINHEVLHQYRLIMNRWDEIIEGFNGPVNFLIVGEATVSWENYFYNSEANTTSFLNPTHFGCQNKEQLIDCFNQNGILVFDLYPLQLPTFIYDKVSFNCANQEYSEALQEFYQTILPQIDENTQIVQRYSKLNNRCEWVLFMNTICRDVNNFLSIAIRNMPADANLINEIFGNIAD